MAALMNATSVIPSRKCNRGRRRPMNDLPTMNDFNESAPQTLRDAWEQEIVPVMDDISDRTMEEYEHALALWERLGPNPDVGRIDKLVIKTFRNKLITTPYKRGKKKLHRSSQTVNRIMRDLRRIISPLWPADRVFPDGLGLVPLFKWPKAMPRQYRLPFVFSAEDLDKLYLNARACEQTPRCRKTALNEKRLWRVALVLALNCGARTWDLFALEWDCVNFDEYEFGSLTFTAKKTGKLHKIPLNECASRHLKWLNANRVVRPGQEGRIFPDFAKGKAFYVTWRRICNAAGVSGTFESMRKTAVTRHNSIIDRAGYWLSGHVEPGVFGHYHNPTDQIFQAVYALKNPQTFEQAAKSFVVS